MSKELPPSRTADQFVARFPDGLRDKIAVVAKENGRSMNAEIVARLQESFNHQANGLTFPIKQAIADEMEDRGGTEEEALLRLVLAGQANGGTIFYATISPQTTIKQLTGMLESCKQIIPPDASIIIERKSTQN